jgi:Fe2+ transport system protein FeoA
MQKSKKPLFLSSAKTGQFLRIVSLPHGQMKSQFIRLGIHEGERVQCLECLPGGTIVLKKSRRHIAIGNELAKEIQVTFLEEKNPHL